MCDSGTTEWSASLFQRKLPILLFFWRNKSCRCLAILRFWYCHRSSKGLKQVQILRRGWILSSALLLLSPSCSSLPLRSPPQKGGFPLKRCHDFERGTVGNWLLQLPAAFFIWALKAQPSIDCQVFVSLSVFLIKKQREYVYILLSYNCSKAVWIWRTKNAWNSNIASML